MNPESPGSLELLTDAVLLASRALVAVASRSLASVGDEVTLPQYRALVVMAHAPGGTPVGDLAQDLRITSSTATRLCDRLVRKKLARRRVNPNDRRETLMLLTVSGSELVAEVTRLRKAEIDAIMAKVSPVQHRAVIDALTAFCVAAGETELPSTFPPL